MHPRALPNSTSSGNPSISPRLRRAPLQAKDRSHGVSGCLLAFEVLVVVACHGAVGSLELEFSIGRNENRGHHGQRSKKRWRPYRTSRRHHSSCRPRYSRPPTSYHAGYRVIDECVEIFKTKTFEVALVFLIHFVRNISRKRGVVLLRYGVFW